MTNKTKLSVLMAATMAATTICSNPIMAMASELNSSEMNTHTDMSNYTSNEELQYVDKVVEVTNKIDTIQQELNELTNVGKDSIESVQDSLNESYVDVEIITNEVVDNVEGIVEEQSEIVNNLTDNLVDLESNREQVENVSKPSNEKVLEKELNVSNKETDTKTSNETLHNIRNELNSINSSITELNTIQPVDMPIINTTEIEEYKKELKENSINFVFILSDYYTGDEDFTDEEVDQFVNEIDPALTDIEKYYSKEVNNQVIAVSEALEAENIYNNSYTTQLTSQAKLDAINNLLEAEAAGDIELDNKDELIAERDQLVVDIPKLEDKAAEDKANYEEYKAKLSESFPDASKAIAAGETLMNIVAEIGDAELQAALDNFLATFNEIKQFAEDNKNMTSDFLAYADSREQAAQAKADLIGLDADKQIAEAKKAKAEELYNQAVADLEKAQEELDKAIADYNEQDAAYQEYVKELERLDAEIEQAKEDLEVAQGDLEKAQGILENVKNGVLEPVEGDPAYTKYNGLVNEYLEKQQEIDKLQKELGSLNQEQADIDQRRAELEKELAEAEAELEQAQKDLAEYLENKKAEEEANKPKPDEPKEEEASKPKPDESKEDEVEKPASDVSKEDKVEKPAPNMPATSLEPAEPTPIIPEVIKPSNPNEHATYETPYNPEDTEKPGETQGTTKPDTPHTGVNVNKGMCNVMLMMSAIGLIIVRVWKKLITKGC